MQPSQISSARKRLDESAFFQRSGALLSLLDFLLAAAQEGPIKETWVGAEFYKRSATYDPRADSIARVNVRRLRQKLERFYATEGAEEPFQIVIPVGAFAPVLQPRAGTAPAAAEALDEAEAASSAANLPDFEAEWQEELVAVAAANPLPPRSRLRSRSVVWVAVGVLAAIGVLLAVRASGGSRALATSGSPAHTASQSVVAVSIATPDQSPTPVGTTSLQQAVITFPSRVKLNPTLALAIEVVTQGVPNADFRFAAGGSCAAGRTYFAGESCTVAFTFTPQTPGQRYGAILLQSDSRELAPVLTTFITRTGVGSLPVMLAGPISTILGGPANLGTHLSNTEAIAIDAAGVIFVGDTSNQRVLRLSNGMVSQYGPEFADPTSVALDGAGNLYVAEWGASDVRMIDRATGKTTVVPGTAGIHHVNCVTLDGAGNLYVSGGSANTVYRISPAGVVTTIAGTGAAGYNGDGIPAVRAQLHSPSGLAVDEAGDVYIEDIENNRIRKVDPAGIISTVAGTGDKGFSGDGGPATRAKISGPATQLALNAAGDLFFADNRNNRVRRIDGRTGTITTVAGNGTEAMVEGVPATATGMNLPTGLAFDVLGNLYVTQNGEAVVRRIAASAPAHPGPGR